ncbi:hypothetical protein C9374_012721 [Naegleria lovaniensis]|uniref:Uncharacterized protein n=1 Tax=Naegleria lovaniensis TaxID=51637 RepID=A0AA88KR88_NAELO|nr:uncharacterized protein C9374_012721 [Naegleria lovaniensis]KAG2392469.1 hypothetical protein C9374_012721 [Naegleria lovaniensis]
MSQNIFVWMMMMVLIISIGSVLAQNQPQPYFPPQYQMTMKNYVKGTKVFSAFVAADHVQGKFSHRLTSPQGFESRYIYIQSIDTLYTLNQESSGQWTCMKRVHSGVDNLAMDPLREPLLDGISFTGKLNCQNQETKMNGVCYRYDKQVVASMVIDYALYTNATAAYNLPIQLYKKVATQALLTTYNDFVLGPVNPAVFNLPVPESACKAQN